MKIKENTVSVLMNQKACRKAVTSSTRITLQLTKSRLSEETHVVVASYECPDIGPHQEVEKMRKHEKVEKFLKNVLFDPTHTTKRLQPRS